MKILFKYLIIYIIFLHFGNFNGDISLLVLGVPNTLGLSAGSADGSGAGLDAGSSAGVGSVSFIENMLFLK